ncbi:HU family DNA-binding protein [Psittacicella hinzii]|uniref:HU family DNA-binding protein n=1 Tax=Psittacicella hinzii TaxID=2028575 RepID=UPI0036220AF0
MRRLELANIIIEELSKEFRRLELTHDEANLMINTLLREIAVAVNEGRMVAIRGFGSFKPKYYKGNTNSGIFQRSLANSERVKTTTFARPTFKAGATLRNIK